MRICILLSLGALGLFAGTKKMTVEESLALQRVSTPLFSPDGKWIAYSVSEWDRKNDRRVSHIWVAAAGGGTPVKLTNGEKGENAFDWSPDGSHIAFLADRGAAVPPAPPAAQVWTIRASGGEAEKVTTEDNAVSSFRWSPDGKRIAYIVRDTAKDKAEREKRKKDKFDAIVVDSDYAYSHIWTVGSDGKEKKRVTEGAFSASSPRWSPDGLQIAYVASKMGAQESSFTDISGDRNTDVYVVDAAGGKPRQITTSLAADSDPEWSPDGRQIAFVEHSDEKSWAAKSDILVTDAEGKTPRNLTRDFPDAAGRGMKWTPDGKNVYWTSAQGLHEHVFRVSVADAHISQITEGRHVYSDFDVSPDGKRLAAVIEDSATPGDLWVADVNGGNRVRVTDLNPEIKDYLIAETEAAHWKGAGGVDIEGVLVKPAGYQAGKRYPFILQIHGGPYGAFNENFNARAQIFADNGYAVLMPNPRGSLGYGPKFALSNVGDWGGKDFQDIMAGVDSMITKGIADPDKMVVMGGSYGGFMTFWTITQTNRFKAAIGHAGISDWYSFFGQSDIPGLMEYGFGGYPWAAADTYRKFSPMTYVDRVKTPLMITQGEQDHRVAIAQGEEYYRALKKRGVETVFIRYPREGHGIQEPNHQIDLVGRQLAWFEAHLQ